MDELVESGRASTKAFFQEQERRYARLNTLNTKTDEIQYKKYEKKPMYLVYQHIKGSKSIIGVEIMGENISFHTDYRLSFSRLKNLSRELFSFERLAEHDERFQLFVHLLNNEEIEAKNILECHNVFFQNCFLWDIFRKLIIESKSLIYLQFFISHGFAFTSPTFCPVLYAYNYGRQESLDALLKDPSISLVKDADGNGLFLRILKSSEIFKKREEHLVRFLLKTKYKEVMNQVNNDGETALTVVARNHSAEGKEKRDSIFDCLLTTQGLNVNHQDKLGNTTLHYVVSRNEKKYVKALLSHSDIYPNLKNNEGKMAIQLTNDNDIVKLLTAMGSFTDNYLKILRNFKANPQKFSETITIFAGNIKNMHALENMGSLAALSLSKSLGKAAHQTANHLIDKAIYTDVASVYYKNPLNREFPLSIIDFEIFIRRSQFHLIHLLNEIETFLKTDKKRAWESFNNYCSLIQKGLNDLKKSKLQVESLMSRGDKNDWGSWLKQSLIFMRFFQEQFEEESIITPTNRPHILNVGLDKWDELWQIIPESYKQTELDLEFEISHIWPNKKFNKYMKEVVMVMPNDLNLLVSLYFFLRFFTQDSETNPFPDNQEIYQCDAEEKLRCVIIQSIIRWVIQEKIYIEPDFSCNLAHSPFLEFCKNGCIQEADVSIPTTIGMWAYEHFAMKSVFYLDILCNVREFYNEWFLTEIILIRDLHTQKVKIWKFQMDAKRDL